jgi:hypothetical protein
VYNKKVLTQAENFFYEQRNSVLKVLNLYVEELKREPLFEWIKVDTFTEEELNEMELSKMNAERERETMSKIAKALLTRKQQDKEDGEIIVQGQTTNVERRTKKARSQPTAAKNIYCSVIECDGPGEYKCNRSSKPQSTINCLAQGIIFCDRHGPNHEQHEYQVLKSLIGDEVAVAINKVQDKLKKMREKKKQQRENVEKQVIAMRQVTHKAIEAQSVVSRASTVRREKSINQSIALMKNIEAIVQEAEEFDTSLPNSPAVVRNEIPSEMVVVSNTLTEGLMNQNTALCISPKVFRNRRSSVITKALPVPTMDFNDRRFNALLHQLMNNIFNGRGDPEVKFMESLDHIQYKNILKDLIPMYGLDDANLPSSDKLNVPKNRQQFLKAIYNML